MVYRETGETTGARVRIVPWFAARSRSILELEPIIGYLKNSIHERIKDITQDQDSKRGRRGRDQPTEVQEKVKGSFM